MKNEFHLSHCQLKMGPWTASPIINRKLRKSEMRVALLTPEHPSLAATQPLWTVCPL